MITSVRKIILVAATLSLLLFCGLTNAEKAEKQEVNFKEYVAEVYVSQEHLPDFKGCKAYVNISIDSDFPYSSGFHIEGDNPNLEIIHSLSNPSLSFYFKEPITNAQIRVRKEDSEFQGIKVVFGEGNNPDNITIILSKHFKSKVWSSINPASKENK
jgi:hypothetical protein